VHCYPNQFIMRTIFNSLIYLILFISISNLNAQQRSAFIAELNGGKSFTGTGDMSGIGTQASVGFYICSKLNAGVLYRFDYFKGENTAFNSKAKLKSGGLFIKADIPVWKGLSVDFGPNVMYRTWNQYWRTFDTSISTDGRIIGENSSASYDLNTFCFGGEAGLKYEFCHGLGASCNFSYLTDKNGNNVAALRSGVFLRF